MLQKPKILFIGCSPVVVKELRGCYEQVVYTQLGELNGEKDFSVIIIQAWAGTTRGSYDQAVESAGKIAEKIRSHFPDIPIILFGSSYVASHLIRKGLVEEAANMMSLSRVLSVALKVSAAKQYSDPGGGI